MRRQAPVFARATETTAADVESADFCRNGGRDEDGNERGQDRQSPEIKAARDQCESAEDFQPGQIKRDPDTDHPRQNLVVVDVVGETNRIERFNRAGVNENATDYKIDNAPCDGTPRENHLLQKRPSAQRPTPNIECRGSEFPIIRGSTFSVRCLLHFFVLSHSSQPPSSTKTFLSCASSRKRRATSRLALQLWLLQ